MYKALYRKWRPQTFRDVVGQEAITTALTSQIEAGRVAHAYLFCGTRGTGKTTCAKVLAKTVNCEAPTEDGPCGVCPCCVGIENGSILDVIEIDAASNNGVDDVRDLRDETVYRPGRCKYKVYIIDEVHMLSTAAFNALLKILEEPPSHVIFILATTELHKVPATILSRCQHFDFTRIPADKITARLLEVAEKEGIPLTAGAAGLIAVLADGAMRDALSLLDTCAAFGEEVDDALVRRMAGVTDKSYLFALSEAAAAGQLHSLLALVAELRERAIDVKRLTEELVGHYRNFLLAAAKPDGSLLGFLPADEREKYLAGASGLGDGHCVLALHRLADALERMSRSQDPRVELELALFDLAQTSAATPVLGGQGRGAAVETNFRGAPPMGTTPVQSSVDAQPNSSSFNSEHNSGAPGQSPLTPLAEKGGATAPALDVPINRQGSPPNDAVSPKMAPSPQPPSHSSQPSPPPLSQPSPPSAPSQPPSSPASAEPPPPVNTGEAEETESEAEVFAPWPQVVEQISKADPMVYSYIKTTTGYFNGRRILIEGGDLFMEFIRSDKNVSEVIKAAIHAVTGMRYGIGPYKREKAGESPADTTRKTLAEWEQKGVPIEYEGEPEQSD